jgi:rSAM/selenodomain-associated transferase 1
MQLKPMNNNLLLFVKYPENGGVKTRLAKSIGDAAAVSLYKCFVEDILSSLQCINAHTWICYYPESSIDDMPGWLGSSYFYLLQKGENLGKRLQHCFKSSFDKGFEKTIVLASDIPEISENIINNAFKILEYKDAVIGPSFDGGYYLVGFNKKSYAAQIFDDISWSTDLVYEETLRKIEAYKLRYSVLDKINDMDTIDDIRKFSIRNGKDLSRGLKTKRCIEELFVKGY